MDPEAAPEPDGEVVRRFGVEPEQFLGGGHHQSWRCRRPGGEPVVLRVRPPLGEVSYEHRVAARLDESGWPVPVLVDEPITVEGGLWGLFRWLPGVHRTDAGSPEEQRDRGALLAEIHDTTSGFLDLGQRPGCVEAHDVVADPTLDDNLAAYGVWFPDEARLMAWHLERARARFAELPVDAAPRVVLHGDFASWNLLYEDGRMTGVLDLEATHVNLAVADFALSWRGDADEVVLAYDRRRPLDELDWELLTPVWWSWLFLGVAKAIGQMRQGETDPRILRWTVVNLAKRSPLMRGLAPAYAG